MQRPGGRGPSRGAAAPVPRGLRLSQRDCANPQLREPSSLRISGCTLLPGGGDLPPAPWAAFKVQAEVPVPRQLIPAAPAPLPARGLRRRDRSMRLLRAALLCLSLSLGRCSEETAPDSHQQPPAESSYSDWGIDTIRDGFETVNSYFDSFLELLGGKNGVCQYRCRYGK